MLPGSLGPCSLRTLILLYFAPFPCYALHMSYARGLLLLCRFEKQTGYQFFSASILIIYEGCPAGESEANGDRRVSLRLVDFAHVVYGKGHDTNFLEALDAVTSAFSLMLDPK